MYRWVDHTAELELAIEAASERDVLADALAALAELLGVGGGGAQAAARRSLSVHATDRPALLAAWLEELVFLAESQGFVATRVVSLELDDSGWREKRGDSAVPRADEEEIGMRPSSREGIGMRPSNRGCRKTNDGPHTGNWSVACDSESPDLGRCSGQGLCDSLKM